MAIAIAAIETAWEEIASVPYGPPRIPVTTFERELDPRAGRCVSPRAWWGRVPPRPQDLPRANPHGIVLPVWRNDRRYTTPHGTAANAGCYG